MYYCYLDTPIGQLLLAGDGESLRLIAFPDGPMRKSPESGWTLAEAPFSEARRQLDEYFRGERQSFDLPLRPDGTVFQLSVLEALREIPYGATASYGVVAKKIGRPGAARAVGAANGRNPLPIVIPCHRVIGSDGGLTGFGGGIATKKALLVLEQSHSR
jgi:methylated-DNA-[protein]-cysteine S-methyltransferase